MHVGYMTRCILGWLIDAVVLQHLRYKNACVQNADVIK